MPRHKQKAPVNLGYITSRHTYKKLGTIIEHLTETVNPLFFELRVTFSQNASCVIVRIWPYITNPNMVTQPVWELIWTPQFNNKIIIDPNFLIPGVEW